MASEHLCWEQGPGRCRPVARSEIAPGERERWPVLISELRATIEAIAGDTALYEERNVALRAEALEQIDVELIDRIAGMRAEPHPPAGLQAVLDRAEQVRRELEGVDAALFTRIRTRIRAGVCRGPAFLRLLRAYFGRDLGTARGQQALGYDSLDLFVNGLFGIREVPAETCAREPEMVAYQKTPARVIIELAVRACLTPADVFYDLGSGLGQVPILVHLLSSATSHGVEIEPAFCELARACAATLGLTQVTIHNVDARTADYSAGNVFYLYTPFEGAVLRTVLERLREVALGRNITVAAYGPCVAEVARQDWLASHDNARSARSGLSLFRGR